MLNILWPCFIIISFVYAFIAGNISEVNNSIFSSTSEAVELCITLFGSICLWSGIMKIAETTSLKNKIKKALKPLIKLLFPEIRRRRKSI